MELNPWSCWLLWCRWHQRGFSANLGASTCICSSSSDALCCCKECSAAGKFVTLSWGWINFTASSLWLAMPVSPSCVSGISACLFGTVREKGICMSRVCKLSILTGSESKTTKTSSRLQLQACSFFLISFLEFWFLNPHHLDTVFCPHIRHFKGHSSRLPVHCTGGWNTLKKMISRAFHKHFFLLCHFLMNLDIQSSWPHWSSTYKWQFFCQKHSGFHGKGLTNLWVTQVLPIAIISLCALPCLFQMPDAEIFFQSLRLQIDFLSANWPHKLLSTVCFQMLAAPGTCCIAYPRTWFH